MAEGTLLVVAVQDELNEHLGKLERAEIVRIKFPDHQSISIVIPEGPPDISPEQLSTRNQIVIECGWQLDVAIEFGVVCVALDIGVTAEKVSRPDTI